MVTSDKSLPFKKINRLLKPVDFQAVFDSVDCKQGGKYCTMLTTTSLLPASRLGLIVSKRNVHLAVNRNRAKRVVRECFRHYLPDLLLLEKQFDIIVIIKASVSEPDNPALIKELNLQWSKLIAKRRQLTIN